MHTIMTHNGPGAPGRCDSFTRPPSTGGCCARCGQPDWAHQVGGREREARISAVDGDQITMAMMFIAGYSPSAVDAALEATGPCAEDEADGDYGPEPYCTQCGASAGIFTALSGDWKHYRWDYSPGSKPEVYDPGHRPVIGWRSATSPESAVAF